MATTTATRPAKKAAAKTKPAPAPEPVDEDVAELGELDEVEEVAEVAESKPIKGKKDAAKAADKPAFGTAELAKHVSEATGKEYDGKAIRVLLRKLARDGKLGRTVGEDRSRYSFTGPNDPQVKAIVAAVKSGDIEKEKKEKLDKLKADKAAKAKAAKDAAPAVEEVEGDEDISELGDEDGDGDE